MDPTVILSNLDRCEKRLLWSLPRDVRDCLSGDQVARLLKAVRPTPSQHLFSLQSSIKGLTRRYYIALFFGLDQRNVERLREEGQIDVVPVSIAFFIILAVVSVLTVIVVAFVVYLAKSWLGIDLMDGPSPIHQLICG